MASSTAGVKTDRPSFAKIAASGMKPPVPQPTTISHENAHIQNLPSPPPDGSSIVAPLHGSHPSQSTPKQKKLVPLMAKEQRAQRAEHTDLLQVNVQKADTAVMGSRVPNVQKDAMLSTTDESGTQVSSSSGSGKPPSLDGKSVASGTTFALDEKESLRPDDSASVKAGEDDDLFSAPGSGLPSSRMGSEDGTRAFRDQLREISRMGPTRQAEPRPSLPRGSSQGVLYVPSPGPGVGAVPAAARASTEEAAETECLPDPRLLEALESPKDRIMVLKLEQDFVDFVKDPKEASLTLPQLNGYHRMLAHRLADYYMLGHMVEDSMAVQIYKTSTCRLAPPLTAVAPPSTAASTPPPNGPQMKILRRGDNVGPTIANGSNAHSKPGSENGESGTDEKKKYPLTREEREANYEAARKRIMGSARPSESAEDATEKDPSRSSSTAPKKTKKKQRNDSDDDFEARSAFSAYYTQPFPSVTSSAVPYGFAPAGVGHEYQASALAYGGQMAVPSGQQYSATGTAWPNQSSFQPQQNAPSPWPPNVQQPYDLSNDFQRAMSLQSPAMPSPSAGASPAWPYPRQQQYGAPQQQWPGQIQSQGTYQPAAQHDNFRPSSSSSQTQGQPYAFGQLPSQTFPGRPPSNLEHPLPGSYKGKHFNPQSQSFIPNVVTPQSPSTSAQAFMSPALQPPNSPFASYGVQGSMAQHGAFPQRPPFQQQSSSQQQRQAPYQQHGPGYQQQQACMAPQLQQQPAAQTQIRRTSGQPLTHPLPQPVFPRQPSPNMPLPAKPGTTPPRAQEQQEGSSYGHDQRQEKESTIAKWGAPPSLPAKPPPSNEPFDPMRFAQNQRHSSHGSSRIPSNSSGYGQAAAAAGRM